MDHFFFLFPRFPAGNSKPRKCATLLGAFECYKIGSAANLHLVELNYSISQPQGRACGIIQANIWLQMRFKGNLQA